jgi:hypothetical protein
MAIRDSQHFWLEYGFYHFSVGELDFVGECIGNGNDR